MSDSIAVMRHGKVVEHADRDTLLGAAGHPSTRELLLDAVPHLGAGMEMGP